MNQTKDVKFESEKSVLAHPATASSDEIDYKGYDKENDKNVEKNNRDISHGSCHSREA